MHKWLFLRNGYLKAPPIMSDDELWKMNIPTYGDEEGSENVLLPTHRFEWTVMVEAHFFLTMDRFTLFRISRTGPTIRDLSVAELSETTKGEVTLRCADHFLSTAYDLFNGLEVQVGNCEHPIPVVRYCSSIAPALDIRHDIDKNPVISTCYACGVGAISNYWRGSGDAVLPSHPHCSHPIARLLKDHSDTAVRCPEVTHDGSGPSKCIYYLFRRAKHGSDSAAFTVHFLLGCMPTIFVPEDGLIYALERHRSPMYMHGVSPVFDNILRHIPSRIRNLDNAVADVVPPMVGAPAEGATVPTDRTLTFFLLSWPLS